MKPKILIVDDDEAIRTQMKWALSEHYEVHFAEDRKAAGEGFEANSPAVTLLDLGLPPRPNECDEGLAVLSDILAIDNTAKVIIISGQRRKAECDRGSRRRGLRLLVQACGDGRTEAAPSSMHPCGGTREGIPQVTTKPAL